MSLNDHVGRKNSIHQGRTESCQDIRIRLMLLLSDQWPRSMTSGDDGARHCDHHSSFAGNIFVPVFLIDSIYIRLVLYRVSTVSFKCGDCERLAGERNH